MTKRTWLLLSAAVASTAVYAVAGTAPALQTVPRVELPRYLGRWYEIARFANRFEKQGDRDTTAEYALRPDGKISVINTTIRNGQSKQARGWAKVADPRTNARLRVTFFWPFFGNYWVIALGKDYEYAVVSEPGRKYLWILSRTPQMSEAQYREITEELEARDFDTDKLIRVEHTALKSEPRPKKIAGD